MPNKGLKTRLVTGFLEKFNVARWTYESGSLYLDLLANEKGDVTTYFLPSSFLVSFSISQTKKYRWNNQIITNFEMSDPIVKKIQV